MDSEQKIELGFVQRRLPWIIAAATFVLYAFTLSHHVSVAGINTLSRVAGWEWRSNVTAPLHVLLTMPFSWLPAGTQLIALNLFSAACGALALGLLARSVALLPHDRTRGQRNVERSDYSLLSISTAWMPPILAVLVCGLQLTFWEHAGVASGEMLDLLIFAWLVHSLLLYRLDEKESRLTWFAVVYGIAVTNNFAMVAFFPAFLVALIWIKGMTFLNWRFILRMVACGMAGLTLYLVLPAIESESNTSGYTFWDLLRSNFGQQKYSLFAMPRVLVAIMCLTSILPIVFIGIRWPAQFGDISPVGNALTNLMTHLIHGIFLLACAYVAFDPAFSPRHLGGGIFAFLPLYYLGALAIGYCAGYFVLVFGAPPGPQAWQRPTPMRKALNHAIVALTWVLFAAVPAGLAYKNLPVVLANSGHSLDHLAKEIVKSLPSEGAVVLSDDSFRLHALQWELQRNHPGHKHLLVTTDSLAVPAYHRFLQERHPDRWPKFNRDPGNRTLFQPNDLIAMLYQISLSNTVVYLHPSFGYYFEYYYPQPRQMVYELKLYPNTSVGAPVLTDEQLRRQDAYWRSLKATEIEPLIARAKPFSKPKPGKDTPRPRTLDTYLCESYSRALNHFGVEAQRAGAFPLAAEYFDWAAKLNPSSPSAFLNLEFNKQWQATKRIPEKLSEGVTNRLNLFENNWGNILNYGGTIDFPPVCAAIGETLRRNGNFRQAAHYLERTLHFDPQNSAVELLYISSLGSAQLTDLALEKIRAYRAKHDGKLSEPEEIELLKAEAWARVGQNNLDAAERLLVGAAPRFPKSTAPWDTLVDIYLQLNRITNALSVLDRQLQVQPDSHRALINYGAINARLDKFAEAIPYYDRALKIAPNDEIGLFNRATANAKLNRLDAAQKDFESLLNIAKSGYRAVALLGLGDVHFRKKNKSLSIGYYEDFIKAAPEGSPEIAVAKDRIKLLESGSF